MPSDEKSVSGVHGPLLVARAERDRLRALVGELAGRLRVAIADRSDLAMATGDKEIIALLVRRRTEDEAALAKAKERK